MKRAESIEVLSKKEVRSLTCGPDPECGAGRDTTPLGLESTQCKRLSFTIYKATSVVFDRISSEFVPGSPIGQPMR